MSSNNQQPEQMATAPLSPKKETARESTPQNDKGNKSNEKNNKLHDNNLRGKYTVEKEDDFGQQQQVSGAFGDSSNVDEQTILLIMQQ